MDYSDTYAPNDLNAPNDPNEPNDLNDLNGVSMILVDAHVHIYNCFDLELFFDSAFANFRSEAARLGHVDDFTGILLLTETSKDNWFECLTGYAGGKDGIGSKPIGNWTFHHTNETCSLCIRNGTNESLFLIAGRQIVTEENLEVLALITEREFEDGLPLTEMIQSVRNYGAIPVIPWGFGKWAGRRGAILREILEANNDVEVFLGDNGNRPSFLPRSSHFKLAEMEGIRVLPGSDPLPFASESCRPGTFGFSVEGSITSQHPAKDLKRILLDPSTRPRAYGLLEKPYRFLRNQLAMQILKRLNKPKNQRNE